MKPTIIVDANPIISALIGGYSREILFNHYFEFITTSFTLLEVRKYLPYIAEKADITVEFLEFLLNLLPLKVYSQDQYGPYLPRAKELIKDKKDIEVLALGLATNFPIWSNDKHFEGIKEISLIKTKDLV